MTRHKIVIATIAVAATLLYALPAQNLASATDEVEQEAEFEEQDLAQRLIDETEQEIDQDADQRQRQDQEVTAENELEQTNEADVDQSEENNQANVIETGDNTATTSLIADNDAIGNALASEAEGGDGGDGKNKKSDYSSSGGSGGAAEASSSLEVSSEQEASTEQDSSADDNTQTNVNEFGDDVAVVDQDNTATQTATAVGVQEQDQDLNQYATNVDLTAQLGEQAQTADFCASIPEDVDIQGGGPGDRVVDFTLVCE